MSKRSFIVLIPVSVYRHTDLPALPGVLRDAECLRFILRWKGTPKAACIASAGLDDAKLSFDEGHAMLTPLCLYGLDLTQRIVSDEEVDRLSRAKNIHKKCKARSQDDSWELVLYVRFNVTGLEAGLISLPGPTCEDDELFPKRMLRVFGKDYPLCLGTVADHYRELIEEHNLYQIECSSSEQP